MVDGFAKVAGLALLLMGILGFFAPLTPEHKLFGLFLVNPMHNMVHLISGLVLLSAGFSVNFLLIRQVVLFFALIYGVLTVLGLVTHVVFGMHVNAADNILHLAITATALLFAVPSHHAAQ